MEEGKTLIEIDKEGHAVLHMEGVFDAFVNWYWDEVRFQIHNGFIEEGCLDWEDVASIEKTMGVLARNVTIPDDIIGEFAKRGYGEFYPNETEIESIVSDKD